VAPDGADNGFVPGLRPPERASYGSAVTREPLPRRAVVRAAILAAILVGSVAVFIYLLQQTLRGGMDAFDRTLIATVAAHRTPAITTVALGLTALGSRVFLWIATTLTCAILWAAGRRLAAIDTALASSAAALVTRLTKVLLARPRPAEQLIHVGGFSFPSGHASGITALLTAIALHTIETTRSRRMRLALAAAYALLVLGVAGSRVYLGVHYPSDVIAGVCVGVACALGAHGLLRTRAILRTLRPRVS
jgi:undecaprenyl-diphosphatase